MVLVQFYVNIQECFLYANQNQNSSGTTVSKKKKKTPCDAFTNLTVSDDTAAFDIYDAVSKVNPTHLK